MNLEVYVFNSPTVSEAQIYNEETLPDFPGLDILRKKLQDQVLYIDWLDAVTGQINTSDYQGQLLIDNDQKVIYFRIVSGNDPLGLILNLCRNNGWASYTPENELFLDPNLDTKKFWKEFKTYKGIIDNIFFKRDKSKLD